MPKGIIYNLLDHLELIDWTGRQIRENKTGSIDSSAPPILLRIGIAPEHWIELCTHFEERFKGLVGSQHSLKNLIKSFGLNRKTNYSNSRLLYCWRLTRFSFHIYVDRTVNELSLHGRVVFLHQISDFTSPRSPFLLPAVHSLSNWRDLTVFWSTDVVASLFYNAYSTEIMRLVLPGISRCDIS